MTGSTALPNLSAKEIRTKRDAVRDRARTEAPHLKTAAPEILSGNDLRLLFNAYDDLFFLNRLSNHLETSGSQIFFEVSNRMTSAGANIRREPVREMHIYRIAVSAPVLFASFRKRGETLTVNGVGCTDRLQALQILMEHELVHLYEMLTTGSSGHGPSFKRIASGLFGHTDFRHRLVTFAEHASASLGLHAGDEVCFRFDGRRLVGTLNRITRRATVLVPDEKGVEYGDGRRYLKFYVPLNALTKA